MTVPTSATNRVLRKRFGAWLKERREEAGLTQLELALALSYAYPTTVSQIERGATALPTHDHRAWAEALKIKPKELADKWLYFLEPNIWASLHDRNPHDIENLPHSEPTILRSTPRTGKKPAR